MTEDKPERYEIERAQGMVEIYKASLQKAEFYLALLLKEDKGN